MTTPLTLSFNYNVTPDKNEYGPFYKIRISAHDAQTAHYLHAAFNHEAHSSAIIALEESLSFTAFSCLESARARNPNAIFSDEVIFIDEKGDKKTIRAAIFTPH